VHALRDVNITIDKGEFTAVRDLSDSGNTGASLISELLYPRAVFYNLTLHPIPKETSGEDSLKPKVIVLFREVREEIK